MSTKRIAVILTLVVFSLTLANAGKPVPPPPPPPPSNPALVYADAGAIKIANPDGSSPWVLLGPANVHDRKGPYSRHQNPSWSPDGQWVVFWSHMPIRPANHPELNATGEGIYKISVDGQFLCKVTSVGTGSYPPHPVWSPAIPPGWSRQKIAYQVHLLDPGAQTCPPNNCHFNIFLVDTDCSAAPAVNITNRSDVTAWEPAWSPDATKLAVAVQWRSLGVGQNIALFSVDGPTSTFEVDLGKPPTTSLYDPDWSRDGGTIAAYGAGGVWTYTLPYGPWILVSPGDQADSWPTWSPDSSQIIFERDRRQIWTMDALGVETPVLLVPSGSDPDRRRF